MLLVTYGIQNIYNEKSAKLFSTNKFKSKLVPLFCTLLLLFYFTANSFFNVKLCLDKFYPKQNSDVASKYIHENSKALRIVAPMTFIFNEIDSFKSIQGEMYYTEMQKTDSLMYQQGFLEATKKFNIDYILLSPPHIELLGMDKCPSEIYTKTGFEQILLTDKMLIVKRKK